MKDTKRYAPIHAVKTKEMHALGFDILELSQHPEKSYDSSVPHRHNYYEVFVFENGGGRHEIDFKDHEIAADSIHTVAPGQIHTLYPKQAKGYVICFSKDFLLAGGLESRGRLRIFDLSCSPVNNIPIEFRDEITELTKKLFAEYRNYQPEAAAILQSYLNILLIKIAQFAVSTPAKDRPKAELQVERFRELIEQHYLKNTTLAAYAHMMSISANYLNKLCREVTGNPASQLLDERVLLEAKRLLIKSGKNVQEISAYLGFNNSTYFSRWFKKLEGLSPMEFKARG